MKLFKILFIAFISTINCDLNDFLICITENDSIIDFFKDFINKIITRTSITNIIFYFITNFNNLTKNILACINSINTCKLYK